MRFKSTRWHKYRSIPPLRLPSHSSDDRGNVGSCAVDGRKLCIGLIEDEVKVSAGEHDRLNAIAPLKGAGHLSQKCLVVRRAVPSRRQLKVDAMNLVNLDRKSVV